MKGTFTLRSVHLRVSDLDRSLEFYHGQLGLGVVSQTRGRAELGTPGSGSGFPPTGILVLTEDRKAPPPPAHAAGLFHAALLIPTRAGLGQWLRQAVEAKFSFQGFADHGVSEAVYLLDPDGNGIEVYADRPADLWPRRSGELAMGTEPLDVPDLLAAGSGLTGPVLASASWGHLHLRVTDLDRSQAYYERELGLSLTQRFGMNARFLARDGYHHQLGLNNWGGVDQPQPANSLGLAGFTVALAGITTATSLIDPDGIALQLIPP